jgi:hypothetical protein
MEGNATGCLRRAARSVLADRYGAEVKEGLDYFGGEGGSIVDMVGGGFGEWVSPHALGRN